MSCFRWRAAPKRRIRLPPSRAGAKRRLTLALRQLEVRQNLKPFDPRVASTLGTGLETPRSDIDIVCTTSDPEDFLAHVIERYGMHRNFRSSVPILPALANFSLGRRLDVEIYGTPEPTQAQPAIVHAEAHRRLLQRGGPGLARRARHLKLAGYSTEQALAFALGLRGDPYAQLNELGACPEDEIETCLRAQIASTHRSGLPFS